MIRVFIRPKGDVSPSFQCVKRLHVVIVFHCDTAQSNVTRMKPYKVVSGLQLNTLISDWPSSSAARVNIRAIFENSGCGPAAPVARRSDRLYHALIATSRRTSVRRS